MDPKECLAFLKKIEKLKSNPRHSWTADGTRETVAAHTFEMCIRDRPRTVRAALFLGAARFLVRNAAG